MQFNIDVKVNEKFSIKFKAKFKIDSYLKAWLEQDRWYFDSKGKLKSEGNKADYYDYVLARLCYQEVVITRFLANVRKSFDIQEKVR